MRQEKRRDGTHSSYYVDYNGFKLNLEQVNSAFLYTLLPHKDIQKYGDYWAILRRRPGAAALTIPEYMPNKQRSIVTKKFFATSNVQDSHSLHHVIGWRFP
jgi:hypothetical protein